MREWKTFPGEIESPVPETAWLGNRPPPPEAAKPRREPTDPPVAAYGPPSVEAVTDKIYRRYAKN